MKRPGLVLVILAAVGLPVALGARAVWDRGAAGQTWEVVSVTRRDLSSMVKATGVVRPKVGAEVRVGSRISGIVTRLLVQVGDEVEKGQLLAELDSAELRALRDRATAALGLARANVSYARADLERKRELATAQLISPSELDLANQALTVAERNQEAAGADLAYAETQLEYARIHSPISGVIASVSTREGETVSASLAAPTFVTILDLDRLEVWAYVDETDIGRIREGQSVQFTVDTYPGTDFVGRVEAIYPQPEIQDNVVNYVTLVEFQRQDGRTLRPEMTTAMRISLETRADVLAVPNRAVRRERGRRFVYAVASDERGGSFVKRWIETGWRDETYWEVRDGLEEGDGIVIGDVPSDAESSG